MWIRQLGFTGTISQLGDGGEQSQSVSTESEKIQNSDPRH